MNAFPVNKKVIQNITVFGGDVKEGLDAAKKYNAPGTSWLERPAEPATKTVPDGSNNVHFVEAIKVVKP